MFVKQFGIQRSGTNYVKALIEENFMGVRVLTNTFGNKHAPPAMQDMLSEQKSLAQGAFNSNEFALLQACDLKEMPYIFVTKEPLSWILSYHKLRRLKNPGVYRELTHGRVNEYLDFYFRLHSSWVKFVRQNKLRRFYFADYDRIIRDPNAFIDEFSFACGYAANPVEKRVLEFANSMRRGTENMTGQQLEGSAKFDKEYYLTNRFLREFNSELLRYILVAFNQRSICFPETALVINTSAISAAAVLCSV